MENPSLLQNPSVEEKLAEGGMVQKGHTWKESIVTEDATLETVGGDMDAHTDLLPETGEKHDEHRQVGVPSFKEKLLGSAWENVLGPGLGELDVQVREEDVRVGGQLVGKGSNGSRFKLQEEDVDEARNVELVDSNERNITRGIGVVAPASGKSQAGNHTMVQISNPNEDNVSKVIKCHVLPSSIRSRTAKVASKKGVGA
ncbi:hypothetical protein V6N11_013762 [Hibiscus sabdariffa]|uniref:Uncharacterized protein n=1 Tax=Hibiscus sabdariffa TaxID=183260 RepID=A0ABR2PDB6_9ROSI